MCMVYMSLRWKTIGGNFMEGFLLKVYFFRKTKSQWNWSLSIHFFVAKLIFYISRPKKKFSCSSACKALDKTFASLFKVPMHDPKYNIINVDPMWMVECQKIFYLNIYFLWYWGLYVQIVNDDYVKVDVFVSFSFFL